VNNRNFPGISVSRYPHEGDCIDERFANGGRPGSCYVLASASYYFVRTVIPTDGAACANVTLRSALRLGLWCTFVERTTCSYYVTRSEPLGVDGTGNRCTIAPITPAILMPMTVYRVHESLVTTDREICSVLQTPVTSVAISAIFKYES